MQYKCEICDKEYDSLWGLSSHNVKKHKIKPEETFIKYKKKYYIKPSIMGGFFCLI